MPNSREAKSTHYRHLESFEHLQTSGSSSIGSPRSRALDGSPTSSRSDSSSSCSSSSNSASKSSCKINTSDDHYQCIQKCQLSTSHGCGFTIDATSKRFNWHYRMLGYSINGNSKVAISFLPQFQHSCYFSSI